MQLYLPKWDQKGDFELRKVFAYLGLQKMLQTATDFNSIQPGLKIKRPGSPPRSPWRRKARLPLL